MRSFGEPANFLAGCLSLGTLRRSATTSMKSLLLLATGLAVAVCFMSALPAAAQHLWPQYGFRANHASFNNLERTLTRSNVGNLTFAWAGEVGTSIASAPVVGRGIVYVAAGGNVFAFRASDGTQLWAHLSCSGEGTVQPALTPNAVIVGDGGGDLAAYDLNTGEQIWCNDESGSITSAPAVDHQTVYITNGGDVVAVNARNGLTRWVFTTPNFSPVTNTPAVLRNTVYVTGGNSVFALDKKTGHLLWRVNLGPQANISAPSVAGGTVYVGGTEPTALRASDGHVLWRQGNVGVNVTTPAIAYNKVYVNSQDPAFGLWALDASTGAIVWGPLADEQGDTVTVANGVVYEIEDGGSLSMFDANTGAFLASVVDPGGHAFNDLFFSQPAVVNGTVYVPTADCCGGPNRVDAFRLPD